MNYISKCEGLKIQSLRILNLSSNNLRNLENLEDLQNLEVLDISKNKLKSLGCLEITPLKSLKRLLCSNNLIPNTYLDTLEVVVINHQFLEELNCIGNEVIMCKSFVQKMSKHSLLKILNGVPVFRNSETKDNIIRKQTEKQKSDIRASSSRILEYNLGVKGNSLQDVLYSKNSGTNLVYFTYLKNIIIDNFFKNKYRKARRIYG